MSQIDVLRKNKNNITEMKMGGILHKDIADKFNVSKNIVDHFAEECRNNGNPLLKQENLISIVKDNKDIVINMYGSGHSTAEIAKVLSEKYNRNIKNSNVKQFMGKYRKNGNCIYSLYNIKEEKIIKFFNSALNEKLAYCVAFFLGDANIYRDMLRIELSNKDKNFLFDFVKLFDFNPIIKNRTVRDKYSTAWYSFGSIRLCEILKNRFGIIPNKSLIMKYPEVFIESKYENAFIRGIWDAEGCNCLSKRKNYNNIIFSCTFVSGSHDFIFTLAERINYLINIEVKIYKRKKSNCYQFQLTQNKALKFCDFIYKDSGFCLERKKNKYLEYKKMKGL